MSRDDTADVLTLLQWFADFTSTQNWDFESQYSSKNSPNNSKKCICENTKVTGNYWSSVAICSPEYISQTHTQTSAFFLDHFNLCQKNLIVAL